jgi:hypothetical protein
LKKMYLTASQNAWSKSGSEHSLRRLVRKVTCNLSCTGSWKVSQQPTQRSFLPAGLRLKHKHLPRLLSPRGLPMDISEGSIRGRKPVYVQLASLLDKSMLAVRKKRRRCIRTAMSIIWMGYN